MEDCFLSNKATLNKKDGSSFTSREIDVISCLVNGGTAKSSSKILDISPHTISTHIKNIRIGLNCNSQDQIIKIVESSDNYIQIRERYIDLMVFYSFEETLEKIKTLNIPQKYRCVIHTKVEEIDKYILLKYLKLANIKVEISRDSTDYAEDKFHIICYSINAGLDKLNADNIVVSKNHNNNVIDLAGKCVESHRSGTQYKSYFSLLGCIRKIYSSKEVDSILDEFKDLYFRMKDKDQIIQEQSHIKITDKRKTKYVALFFTMLLVIYISTHLYNEIHKTHLTNINMLVVEDIFLKRKDLISKMDKILANQEGVKFLILVGQGGIGKTTLARHYINKNASKIKWEINTVTEESTIKSFLELAIELSKGSPVEKDDLKFIQAVEEPEIRKKKIVSFVFSQLKERKDWILLFDNVDDFKMIYRFILPNKDLCNEGTIIITTRNANCGNLSFIPDNSVLDIGYLEKDEKKKLFCDILYGEQYKSRCKTREVDSFLEDIPPMPLDISNAAYYIKNTNSSFEKYLEILRSPNEETERLHSKFLNEGMEYNKTRYKMTLAVFDKLIETDSNFKELLLFICLLDSKNIPRKYLDKCRDFATVSDFLQNLKRFFSINLNNGRFSVHKSIQEIGLSHLATILTNNEKKVFFEKIINIMTPYSSILWQKYKTYPCKLERSDLDELEMHIKSMLKNIKLFKLPEPEENKYITKLLLAIGFIYGEDNFSQAKHYLNEALKYNKNNGYIGNYEYAIALLVLGYAHLTLDELDDAKLWLNEALELCKNLKDSEILKTYGLCDLGRCYAKTNEFNMSIILSEKALGIVDDNPSSWARNTTSQICLRLSHTYADHYINKSDGNKAVIYAQKSLKKLGLEENIQGIKKKSESGSGVVSRWCLTKAYNRLGKHDEAKKCADCYYYLYEKYFKNDDHILSKAVIDIEYGYILLRKGELISALDVLNRVINIKKELNDNHYLFHALVSRIEVFIRLNKLDEAYRDFQYIIKQQSNKIDNYTRLLFCISLYHAFIIKYKQKDYKLSLEHFSDFCSSIKEFCEGFLSASAYDALLKANAFEVITDESQMKTCLQNSLKIFSSIYGNDHPFVRSYVEKIIIDK